MSGKLLLFKPFSGGGKLVFGDEPSNSGSSFGVQIKTMSGFITAVVHVFNGTEWAPGSVTVIS